MSLLSDKTQNVLGANINFRQMRQNILTANIANAETPGYKAKKVDFEGALARAMEMEGMKGVDMQGSDFPVGKGSIARTKADVYDDPTAEVNNDGNSVNLENQMTKMAENTIMYNAAIQLINKKMGVLKYAISEGGR